MRVAGQHHIHPHARRQILDQVGIVREEDPRYGGIDPGERLVRAHGPVREVVHTGNGECRAGPPHQAMPVHQDVNSARGDRGRHRHGVDPVVVIAEHRDDSVGRGETPQRAGQPGELAP